MVDTSYNFDISKANLSKVFKTVRGAIKKGVFYLGLKESYETTERLIDIQTSLVNTADLRQKLGGLYEIFELDAKIRYCDDLLDDVLAKQDPVPFEQMRKVVDDFVSDVSNPGNIPALFRGELELLESGASFSKSEVGDKITRIVDVRPCDYFLILERLIAKQGTVLSPMDYNGSLHFYKEFQRLRDLLDDMMSIEEDILKGDYNSIVIAKKYGVSYHFFDSLVQEKFNSIKKSSQEITEHPHKSIFLDTVNFWTEEYEHLFKRLLVDYYIDIEEFKRSYFLIKQL